MQRDRCRGNGAEPAGEGDHVDVGHVVRRRQDHFITRLGSGHAFSTTQLETYGRCPFRFFAQRLLNIAPLQDPDADLVTRFADAPNRWYATNQLGWYLGADADDVLAVFDRIVGLPPPEIGDALQAALTDVMGNRSLVDAARRRLDTIDVLGLSDAREGVLAAVGDWLGVAPPDSATRRNARSTLPPIQMGSFPPCGGFGSMAIALIS